MVRQGEAASLRAAQKLAAKEQKKSDKSPGKWTAREWWSVGALSTLLLIVVLCIVATQYSFRRVTLAGIPVTNHQSTSELQKQLQTAVDAYQITVVQPGGQKQSYKLADTGLAIDVPASVNRAQEVKKPEDVIRRLRFWQPQAVPLVVKTDPVVLQNFLQNKATVTNTPATDAAIVIDNGTAVVTVEKNGEGYSLGPHGDSLVTTVSQLSNRQQVMTKQQLSPQITKQQAQLVADKINKLVKQPISFVINGKQITPSPNDISGWLDINANPSKQTIDYSVNSGKVLSYMNAIAKPYVTPPVTEITFTDDQGNTSTLIPGRNGVDITNKETTANEVAQKIMAGQAVNQELPVRFASFGSIQAQPHDKWIVVDTSTKRMYAYEQTTLVRTFLISAGAPLTPTVKGQFQIYSKYTVQDMRGSNVDGSQYFQPHVHWINYFYADYAIHGNYWRPTSYFGNINSSHGCVGITDSDAEWIYNWAPIGTTVIVHN